MERIIPRKDEPVEEPPVPGSILRFHHPTLAAKYADIFFVVASEKHPYYLADVLMLTRTKIYKLGLYENETEALAVP